MNNLSFINSSANNLNTNNNTNQEAQDQGDQPDIDSNSTTSRLAATNNFNRSQFVQIVDGILNSDLNEIINHTAVNMYHQNANHHGHSHHGHSHSQSPTMSSGGPASNSQMIMNSALSNSDQVVINLLANNNNNNNDNDQTNNAINDPNLQQQQQEMNGPNNFLLLAFKTLQSSLPFVIILIAKIFHQHLLGFFVVLGFMITLQWSNKTLVKQVELKVCF